MKIAMIILAIVAMISCSDSVVDTPIIVPEPVSFPIEGFWTGESGGLNEWDWCEVTVTANKDVYTIKFTRYTGNYPYELDVFEGSYQIIDTPKDWFCCHWTHGLRDVNRGDTLAMDYDVNPSNNFEGLGIGSPRGGNYNNYLILSRNLN